TGRISELGAHRLEVERTDLLANVAASHPAPHAWTLFLRQLPFASLFEREVADAAARIDLMLPHDRAGRAGVEAAPAAAAVIGMRPGASRKLAVEESLSQKEVAALFGVDQ